MPRVNWVKSVPSGQPQRAPSANTSATRASASLPERMISMVGSPLLRYPSTTTMSWPGMLRTMSEHSISPSTDLMRAICPGAAITVSRAPAARWRYESFPG